MRADAFLEAVKALPVADLATLVPNGAASSWSRPTPTTKASAAAG